MARAWVSANLAEPGSVLRILEVCNLHHPSKRHRHQIILVRNEESVMILSRKKVAYCEALDKSCSSGKIRGRNDGLQNWGSLPEILQHSKGFER
ncbi:GL12356 [Drosophila persimilis]|uniref:GL12356 n=1 Tax=Drosophila persimilis TaxID=7234 RepID=B4GMA6_DROPE|nr:GL12356 [Drosophila persimilis]